MNIIVQKFGGTSVASDEGRSRIVRHVKRALHDNLSVVIVVSAMGRAGDPYSTDTLIRLARGTYLDMPMRDLDLLVSCGEIISTVLVCNTLRAAGIEATALTGGQAGIITDDAFGSARILRVDTERIMREVSDSRVAVIAGFQGVTRSGEITTLGRGGSDTTAAAIGAALRASVVEIYTDVDGIKTADPRLVPEARTIVQMTYDEIFQMAYEGAKVIHPRAVEIAMKTGVPLRVKSTFDDTAGTLVTQKPDSGFWPEAQNLRPVSGITHMPGLARIELDSVIPGVSMSRVFRELADSAVSVDMISVTQTRSSFVVKEEALGDARKTLERLNIDPLIQEDCAKVSVVGVGMRGMPGVMANVAEALAQAGVTILQTVDSHMTISCLVRSEAAATAMRALHSRFGLEASENERREFR